MKKTYFSKVEQEIEIEFDMEIYTDEIISQVVGYYNFYAEDRQEFFEELSEFIVQMYLKDGYFDYEIEGLAIDGHKGVARAKVIYV